MPFSWRGRRRRTVTGALAVAMTAGLTVMTGMAVLATVGAAPASAATAATAAHSAKLAPARLTSAKAAQAKAVPDPPESHSTAISLVVNGVPAAGIPAYAGTYATSDTGSAGGNDGGSVFPDPDGLLANYVSPATHTSITSGTPSVPTWAARSDLVAIAGPSLTPGGPKLLTMPALHNFAQCTPPHALMTDSHVTRPVDVFGHELIDDGATVTVDLTGRQLGLPDVQSGELTFTMRTISQRVGVTSAHIRFVITIDGTLTGLDGAELDSGPLATLTLADVTADCAVGPVTADVQITKSGPVTVDQDGTVTYTLDVLNNGPGTASSVTVQDPVDGDLTDAATTTSGCSVTGSSVKAVECSLGDMADGAVRQITITAKVKPGVAAETVIANCGTVYTTTDETDETNNQSCVETTVESPPPAAQTDVTVAKTANVDTTMPGGTVIYTVTVTNNGSDDAHDVVLGDVLGSLGTVTAVTSPLPDECTLGGRDRTLTCTIGTLAPGGSQTFMITATVAGDAADGSVLENCAAADTSTQDTDETNNEHCVETTVGTPPSPDATTDLAVAKSGPDTVEPGGHVTYLLTVTNNSAVDAHDVVVSDVLGDLVDLTSIPDGCSFADQVLTCEIGTLAAGESRTIALAATAASGAAVGDSLQNCEDAETSTEETTLDNNYSCASTLITDTPPPPEADVTIAKSASVAVKPGGPIAYTLTVTNHGPDAASDVVVSDVLADEIDSITAVPTGCSLSGRTLTCPIGTLAAGASRTFTLAAAVSSGLAAGTVVENCGVVYPHALDPAALASCVSTMVRERLIPVGPAPTGGGFAPARASAPLTAGGLALVAAGLLLGAAGIRLRRRSTRTNLLYGTDKGDSP